MRQFVATGVLALCLLCAGSGCLQTECRTTDNTCSPAQYILLALLPAITSPVCNLVGGSALDCGPLNLSGAVTTPYGPAQGTTTPGDADGTGNTARFDGPAGITTDGTNLYVADLINNKIRQVVIATGVVTTLAGPAPGATTSGDADGTGNAARFNSPNGITIDGTNLYVSDAFNNKIRKIEIATRVVTTFAGPAPGATTSGDADGTGNAARFNGPVGITSDGTNLYVADQFNNKIRKIVIATGVVTTIAGPAPGATTSGDADATGNAARFQFPYGITTDRVHLYVGGFTNNKIRKIVIATGVVTTIAGPAPGAMTNGDADGTGNAARLHFPAGLTTDGTNLYVTDSGNNKIRQIVIATGVVTTIAGPAPGSTVPGDVDGTGNAVRLNGPTAITTDGISLYVCDELNNKIRRIQ